MNKLLIAYHKLFFFLFGVLCVFQLAMLDVFRLPWYDEVFMVSIAKNYATTNQLKVDDLIGYELLNNVKISPEIFTYGKLYFQILSTIGKQFGFTIHTMRLPNFMAAGGIIAICLWFLQYLQVHKKYWIFFLCLCMLQEVFFRNLQTGRMDFMAAFFALLALVCYLKAQEKNNLVRLYLLKIMAGIFVALALLTTPEVVLMILPFGILFFYEIANQKQKTTALLSNLLIVVLTAIIYSIYWIFPTFNNFQEFLAVYQNIETKNYIFALHRLSRFGIGYYLLLTPFLLVFFTSLVLFIRHRQTIYVAYLPLLSYIIGCAVCYFFLVAAPQPYLAMLIPLLYVFVVAIISKWHEKTDDKKLKIVVNSLLALLFCVNFAAVSIRIAIFAISYKERDSKVVKQIIEQNIPEKAKVVADAEYYYCLLPKNYQFLPAYTRKDYCKVQNEIYDYEYLIIKKGETSKLQAYAADSELLPIATISFGKPNPLFEKALYFLEKIGTTGAISYEGTIYKKIKK